MGAKTWCLIKMKRRQIMAKREDNHWMIGCDWGTSSFRIWLVDTSDGAVMAEIRSGEGVASTFNQWQCLSQPQIPRFHFFFKKLESMISKLAAKAAADLSKLPIIVTGMASSSIGMEELPYAELPIVLTADKLIVRHYTSKPSIQSSNDTGFRNKESAGRHARGRGSVTGLAGTGPEPNSQRKNLYPSRNPLQALCGEG